MREWIYLYTEQVLEIHEQVLLQHGGLSGIREKNLLESALAAPRATMFGNPIFEDPIEIAAAYLFYLCKNHPFLDGNKRVALASALVFLRMNGLSPRPDGPEWEALVLDVASGDINREATTERLRSLEAT